MKYTKVTEERLWTHHVVRDICVRNRYYTKGMPDEYSHMLRYVDAHRPTDRVMVHVANDILEHSDVEMLSAASGGCTEPEIFCGIMYELSRSVLRMYSVPEEKEVSPC